LFKKKKKKKKKKRKKEKKEKKKKRKEFKEKRKGPWITSFDLSIFSSNGIRKAAVFPVPFFALARISRPANAMGMLSS